MPILATDTDVLDQIGVNNDEAASIAAQIAAITPTAQGVAGWADSLAAWNTDLTNWRAWAGAATGRLSGGFLTGEWFGVASDGNTAISWKQKFDAWQSIFDVYATAKPPPYPAPTPASLSAVSAANAQGVVNSATGVVTGATSALKGPLEALAVVAVAGLVAYLVFEFTSARRAVG
jgi:hypothetical protein